MSKSFFLLDAYINLLGIDLIAEDFSPINLKKSINKFRMKIVKENLLGSSHEVDFRVAGSFSKEVYFFFLRENIHKELTVPYYFTTRWTRNWWEERHPTAYRTFVGGLIIFHATKEEMIEGVLAMPSGFTNVKELSKQEAIEYITGNSPQVPEGYF